MWWKVGKEDNISRKKHQQSPCVFYRREHVIYERALGKDAHAEHRNIEQSHKQNAHRHKYYIADVGAQYIGTRTEALDMQSKSIDSKTYHRGNQESRDCWCDIVIPDNVAKWLP